MTRRPLFLLAPLAMVAALGADSRKDTGPRLTGDAAFGRKEFAKALELYRAELQKGPDAARERRVISCLAALSRWDEAMGEGESYVERHVDSLDGVRGRLVLADVFLRAPHFGFKVGGKVRRGGEHREGEEVSLHDEDARHALALLASAREVLYLFQEGRLLERGNAPPAGEVTAEAIAVDLALAELLQTRWAWGPMPEPVSARVTDRYFAPRKELAAFLRADDLYQEVVGLGGRARPAAVAWYARALLHHRVRWLVERLRQADRPLTPDEQEALGRLGDPVADLRALGDRYPGDPLADDALFAAGRVAEERGDGRTAEGVYDEVIRRYPGSPWVSDARAALQDLRRHEVSFQSSGPVLPGRPAVLEVTARNLSRVTFTAERLDPEAWFLTPAALGDPRKSFGRAPDRPEVSGPAVAARWEHRPEDDGSHKAVTSSVALPALSRGLYRVEARGEGVTFATLVVVSDLALVQKRAADRVLLFAADAVTGSPIADAPIVVRDVQRGDGPDHVSILRGTTGRDGLLDLPLSPHRGYRTVEAVSLVQDRVAATPEAYAYGYEEGAAVHVHLTTDRPAYRPGHTVFFRGVAIRGTQTAAVPLAQAKLRTIVRDPKGDEVYRQDHVTDAFGAFSGSLTLGDEPPLGEYPVEVQVVDQGRVSVAGDRFRVEEYRKPDFEVGVETGAAVRAGELGRAEIVARYYFGSPVADAAVTWRVFRTTGRAFSPFRDPDAWIHGLWPGQSLPGRRARALVTEGSTRTDATGHGRIEWPTVAGEDGQYDVEADVVDLSRREVKGSGSVRATRAAFDLYLQADRGFYRPSETATIDVAALDGNGKPVATPATMVVFRRTWSALHEKVAEDPVTEERLAIDASGHARFRWRAEAPGEFRLALTAHDPRQEKVVTDLVLRVADEGTSSALFRLSGLEMTLDRPSHREGEVARVLVASSRPGAVLLTEEAGPRILNRRVIRLEGKGRVAEVVLTRAHAPNVFVTATQVSDGKVFTAQSEILVPPVPSFLSVEVRPRAAMVKPGQEDVIDLVASDADGHPVAAAFSLAVTDRSIEAIQAPYAPDIRAFFFGERRAAGWIPETSSFAFRPNASTKWDRPEARHRRHGMPPGWYGALRESRSDWAGDELLDGAMAAEAAGVEGGVPGGVVGGVVGGLPASPASFTGAMAQGRMAAKAEAPLAEARTRSFFADTAFWSAAVVTGADGRARVTVKYPDSLADWKVVARGGDSRARVGEATAAVTARKDLMVRLQSPRFFVERDRAVLSALVQNDTAADVDAVTRISVSDVLRLEAPAEIRVHVPRNGQARVEWPVAVAREGEARIRVAALTAVESDAAEQTFAALVHGVDKQVSQAGRLVAGEGREIVLDVPAERGAGTGRLTLTVAPTLVSSLLEAVPYLVDYPYGCVEQTMSRFLPAVVLSRTLRETGARLEDLAERRRRLVMEDRVVSWRHRTDPVFREAELRDMVEAGLRRLYGFQNEAGGWGWWKGDTAEVRMTAYVVYGIATAQQAGYVVDDGVLERALRFLEGEVKNERSLHARAYAAFALATAGRKPADLERLFERRGDLNVYSNALLALALLRSGRSADARAVVASLEDLAVIDMPSDTASWRAGTEWWWWENDRVETNAFVLWALAEVEPDHPLAPKAARWLLLNRQGSQWHSTRDTAHAIYALAAFAKAAGESSPDLTAEVSLGGESKTFRITPESALAFDDTFVVGDSVLGSGKQTLRIRVNGRGVLYYNAVLRYFTKEEDIRGAGTTLRVRREYWKRVPRVVEDGAGRRLEYDRAPLPSLAAVKSGDEVEVRLTLESPTAYDHLVFEDPKPAGFEPVDLRSGSRYADGLCSNMELRDERVAFFVTHLEAGTQAIRYVLRAETPGSYHALPARGYAMYAPEIAALADEWRSTVEP